MSARTNYSQLANLQSNCGISPSAPRYLALMTVAGSDAVPGTECADSSYVRQVVTFGTPTTNPTNCQASNSAPVLFPVFVAPQTIVEWALFDAIIGGNYIYHEPIASQPIAAGNQINFPDGALTYEEQ